MNTSDMKRVAQTRN